MLPFQSKSAGTRGSLAFNNIHNQSWAPVRVEVEHVPERAIGYGWAVHRDAILHRMEQRISHNVFCLRNSKTRRQALGLTPCGPSRAPMTRC